MVVEECSGIELLQNTDKTDDHKLVKKLRKENERLLQKVNKLQGAQRDAVRSTTPPVDPPQPNLLAEHTQLTEVSTKVLTTETTMIVRKKFKEYRRFVRKLVSRGFASKTLMWRAIMILSILGGRTTTSPPTKPKLLTSFVSRNLVHQAVQIFGDK